MSPEISKIYSEDSIGFVSPRYLFVGKYLVSGAIQITFGGRQSELLSSNTFKVRLLAILRSAECKKLFVGVIHPDFGVTPKDIINAI